MMLAVVIIVAVLFLGTTGTFIAQELMDASKRQKALDEQTREYGWETGGKSIQEQYAEMFKFDPLAVHDR